MSQQDARDFVEKILTDDSFRNELNDRLDLESTGQSDFRDRMGDVLPELASEFGYDFKEKEAFEALDDMTEMNKHNELSDGELEQVAGGANQDGGSSNTGINSRKSVGVCALVSIMSGRTRKECMNM